VEVKQPTTHGEGKRWKWKQKANHPRGVKDKQKKPRERNIQENEGGRGRGTDEGIETTKSREESGDGPGRMGNEANEEGQR